MDKNIIQITQVSIEDFMKMMEEKICHAVTNASAKFSNQEKKEVYSREETSKLLNVSLATLHNWAKDGVLTPKKIGKRVYYLASEVQAKLEITS